MNLILNDTTINSLQKQFEILERLDIKDRADMTFELSDKARQKLIDDIKKQHPEFSKQQVKIEIIKRCYGEELSLKVATAKGLKE